MTRQDPRRGSRRHGCGLDRAQMGHVVRWPLTAVGAALALTLGACAATPSPSLTGDSSRPSDEAQGPCPSPSVRPTYLPWIERGGTIPEPLESYDAEIDRAQLSWSDPDFPEGEAGIGLTMYTHRPQGNRGGQTDIMIEGVPGRLHGPGDGGAVSISWDLETTRCNFMELILTDPSHGSAGALMEVVKVGASLE
jgi:hypothetical protein